MSYNPTVVVKPSCAPPPHDVLLIKNYLSEFKSEVDKARVRYNLGIPDEYSFNWGNIKGLIENQADLVQYINAKTANAGSQYESFTGQLDRLSNSLNNLKDQLAGVSIVELNNKINETLAKNNQLWANVAQNSTDISNLYKLVTGDEGGTDFIRDIQALQTNVSNINATLNTTQTRLTTLETEIDSLKGGNVSNKDIELLKSQVAQLQLIVGSNQLVNLTLNVTSDALQDLTIDASDIDIIVTAEYTKIDPVIVTDECSVVISNQSVITWSNNKIKVVGEGTATITFSFRGKSVALNVKVGNAVSPTTKMCYIGWASDYSQILHNSNFETSTLAKNWNDSNLRMLGSTFPTYLWACTPSGTIISKVSQGGIDEIPTVAEVAEDYNIYYLGYAKDSISGVSLTITTANG